MTKRYPFHYNLPVHRIKIISNTYSLNPTSSLNLAPNSTFLLIEFLEAEKQKTIRTSYECDGECASSGLSFDKSKQKERKFVKGSQVKNIDIDSCSHIRLILI